MRLTKPVKVKPSKEPDLLKFLRRRAAMFYELYSAQGIYEAVLRVRQTLRPDYYVLLRALIIEEFAKHGKLVTRLSFDLVLPHTTKE